MDFMISNIGPLGAPGLSGIGNNGNSNSNSELTQICCLCNLQIVSSVELLGDNSESHGFTPEKVLDAFLVECEDEDDRFPQGQLCSSCKILFRNLMVQKEILSSLIDEIINFIPHNSRFTFTNSKQRIISKLFEIGEFPFLLINASSLTNPNSAAASTIINSTSNHGFHNQNQIAITDLESQTLEHQLNSIIVTFVPEQEFIASDLENFSVILVNQDSAPTEHNFHPSTNTDIEKLLSSHSQSHANPTVILTTAITTQEYQNQDKHIQLDFNHDHNDDTNRKAKEKTDESIANASSVPELPENTNKIKEISEKNTNKKLSCPICSKLFSAKKDLACHVGSHLNERKFTCEICGVGYRHKVALETHVALHRGEAKFECEHCKKMFTQKSGLKRHLTIHTGEKAYKCEICDKQFRYHTSLNLHKLGHRGSKEFQCLRCSQSFISKSHLLRHDKVHTGDKPYKCSTCARTFSEKYNLDAHMKTHTRVRVVPYSCPRCQKGFKGKLQLESHISKCPHGL